MLTMWTLGWLTNLSLGATLAISKTASVYGEVGQVESLGNSGAKASAQASFGVSIRW